MGRGWGVWEAAERTAFHSIEVDVFALLFVVFGNYRGHVAACLRLVSNQCPVNYKP